MTITGLKDVNIKTIANATTVQKDRKNTEH
jgi:hypothetical protein